MADIQLRFGKDMLVVSSPVEEQLLTQADALPWDEDGEEGLAGLTAANVPFVQTTTVQPSPDAAESGAVELSLLIEPEVFEDAYRLERAVGANCLVAPTAHLTPARLAQVRLQDAAADLARTAIQVIQAHAPEHGLVELNPSGLPLDAASKASLLENRSQYERAARLFNDLPFDAFLLNGFVRIADLRCALMGIRKVSDAPIITCVDVNAQGMLAPLEPASGSRSFLVCETLEEALAVMAEYGANAVGFRTDADPSVVTQLVQRGLQSVYLPQMVQLFVRPDGPYHTPDDAFDAACALADEGVQFLRATGAATPVFTGALAAAVAGHDVQHPPANEQGTDPKAPSPADADRLRRIVNSALGINGIERP